MFTKMGKATFKCKQCGHTFEAFDTEGGIRAGINLPHCPKCGSGNTRKAIQFNGLVFFTIIVLSTIIFNVSCKNTPKEPELTPSLAMKKFLELTPVDGAKFYKEERNVHLFFDQLYGDSILPALQYCDYYEIKGVCSWLKNTPYYDDAFELYQLAKESYLKIISAEITQNIEYEQKVFKENILPAIELEIDSMLEIDVKRTMSEYAGGILNYKKLNFLFGRGKNDFKQMFWDKFDLEKYKEHISKHINSYLDTICNIQNKYCMEITGTPFDAKMSIDYPELKIGLSKSTLKHIQEYTSKQTDEIWVDIVKDWVAPTVLATASGGISTLYDIGTFAYDIKVTIDDIKEEKIEPDDMVVYVCNHDLSYQIDNYFLNKCIERVNAAIADSNKRLTNEIIKLL